MHTMTASEGTFLQGAHHGEPPRPASAPTVETVDDPADLIPQTVVMLVDDEPVNLEVLEILLEQAGYQHFVVCPDSRQAVDQLRRESPDILLLDLDMPHVSGFDILETMRTDEQLHRIPAIVLTAANSTQRSLRALQLGAREILAKPVDLSELTLRMRNTVATKAFADRLADHSASLESQVRARTRDLDTATDQILHCLATAGEFRDNETGRHVLRVGRYAGMIARQLGRDRDWCQMIENAAQLHDLGKIGVPDSVLLKPGKLTDEEFKVMQRHCAIGSHIIRAQASRLNREPAASQSTAYQSPLMTMAAVIAETHHEKWNGSGYPRGLAGEQIPLEGRIVAIADVYDALSSERPYKSAFPTEKCLAILEEGRAAHFDPQVLDAFLAVFDEIQAVRTALAD